MSSILYSVGDEIRGNGRDKVDPRIESELEARRPDAALCRRDAVYSLEHTDFSVCGVVEPGYIYRLKPNAAPQRWDFAWIGEMQKALLRLKYPQHQEMKKYPEWNANLIERYCTGYWSGAATQEPGWEFLMPSCTVLEVLANKPVDPKSTKGDWKS
ncbi:hypothetical protein [Hyphobacterium indicum]|uniref:hypothetical protein n=1 Tax=Hyphobacterium indicum TaxID=2162714 RepID=UPI000F636EC5|nr:hypothetical protein [Hyphobacterium indicum]